MKQTKAAAAPNPRRRAKATDISQFISLLDEEFDKKIDVVNLI